MIKAPITAVAIAVLVAPVGALAQDAASAKQQMASELGVNADDYTSLELAQMKCRLEATDSDAERERLLREIKGYGEMPEGATDAAADQIATDLGVDAGDYTREQLVWLRGLVESNDCTPQEAQQMMAAGERIGPEAAGAKQQLAASLGVEPTQYTLAELVKMRFDQQHENN